MIRPDPSNLNSLKLFFEENKFLKATELAQIARRSVRTIRLWRERCGIISNGNGWGNHYKTRPFVGVSIKKQPPVIVDRSIWNSKEWFWQKYIIEGFGVPTIARIINRDERIVWTKLKKYGVPIRSRAVASASKNPCCVREWLEEHYEIYGYSLHKCAELADVTPITICNWLAKFNIYIRDSYEAGAGERNAFYGRQHTEAVKAFCRQKRIEQISAARERKHAEAAQNSS